MNLRIVCSVCCALLGGSAMGAEAMRPNVVIFLVDDMGWMDSGAYGSKYYDTPNMDKLATRSLRFTSAYACPLCSPTRASILTGQYSARHGITTPSGHMPPQPPGHNFMPAKAPPNSPVIDPESKHYLDTEQYTLAEALHDAGYKTAHIGKWHLGLVPPYWPEQQGFDTAFHCHPDPGPPGNYFSPYGVVPEGKPNGKLRVGTITDGPPGEYIVDRIAEEAVKFIDENKDRPFYLNFWNYGVHGPWGHKLEYTKKYAERTDPRGLQGNPIMASMLKSVDDSLGRVVGRLDELGLTERTIFIFFSDNGGNDHSNTPGTEKKGQLDSGFITEWRKWAGDRGPTNNAPLREGKGTLYEGGTRVPLMVMWPGRVQPGTTTDAVVGAVDLYPTVLDLLGIAPNPKQKIDGMSIAKVLAGGDLGDRPYFNFFPHGAGVRPPGVWVRHGDWKLIRWWSTTRDHPQLHELYNLSDDLGEKINLATAMPEKVAELDALIDGFLKDTNALVPVPNPAYQPAKNPTAAARPLGGWKAQGCTAEEKDGALIVTSDKPAPFLGIAGLALRGPVEVVVRARGAAGPGKIQWRTSEQDEFPKEGQTVDFAYPGGEAWSDAVVKLPVEGSAVHLRVYLPRGAQPVAIDAIEAKPQAGKPARWDFD